MQLPRASQHWAYLLKKTAKKGGAKKVKETIWLPLAKRINCEIDEGIFFRLLYMTTPCINQTKKHSLQ